MKMARRKKRVLYISFLGLLEPVAYSQVYSYLMGLSRTNNFKIFLITFEKGSLMRRPDYLRLSDIRESLKAQGIEWRVFTYRYGWGKFYNVIECLFCALFLAARKGIELIHARSNEPVLVAYLISLILRKGFIYDRRGIMADDYCDDATSKFRIKKNGLLYRMLEKLERRIMRRATAIIILTQRMRGYLEEDTHFGKGRLPLHVIPCCVNLANFPDFRRSKASFDAGIELNGKFTLNYLGSLSDYYNFDEMVDFFLAAKSLLPEAYFMLLTLSEPGAVEQRMKRKGLRPSEFCVISVSPLKVNEYLCRCDAAIMFFKPTLIRMAASPTKMGESLASGLPVIINKGIGDTAEIIRRHNVGVVIDGFSSQAYAEGVKGLRELMHDQSLRARCREVAAAYFSLDLGVARYAQIYCSIGGRRG